MKATVHTFLEGSLSNGIFNYLPNTSFTSSGAGVQFALHNPRVVGSSLSCVLAAAGRPLSV